MKSVFIVFNQAFTTRVEYMLDELGIRGFTRGRALSTASRAAARIPGPK